MELEDIETLITLETSFSLLLPLPNGQKERLLLFDFSFNPGYYQKKMGTLNSAFHTLHIL